MTNVRRVSMYSESLASTDRCTRQSAPRGIVAAVLSVVLFACMSFGNTTETSEPGNSRLPQIRWASATVAYSALHQFNGEWRGVGDGKWGASSAEKTFSAILGGRVICRSGRSVYPVQDLNPDGEVHEALALFALISDGDDLILTEYDNEGFIARYTLDLVSSEANKTWVFELVSGENLPPQFRARLTIFAPEKESYVEAFDLNFGGQGYKNYLTNRLSRVSENASDDGCRVK